MNPLKNNILIGLTFTHSEYFGHCNAVGIFSTSCIWIITINYLNAYHTQKSNSSESFGFFVILCNQLELCHHHIRSLNSYLLSGYPKSAAWQLLFTRIWSRYSWNVLLKFIMSQTKNCTWCDTFLNPHN